MFGAYLEDFHEIKVIIPASFKYQELYLTDKLQFNRSLKVFREEKHDDELHLFCYMPGYFNFQIDYYILINNKMKELEYYLNLGKIIRSNRFDIEFSSNEELGISFKDDETIFRLWAPVCKEVILILDNEEYTLNYKNKGIWEISIKKKVLGLKYHYKIRINREYIFTLDPYAHSCTPNFTDNIVVDLKESYQIKNNYLPKINNPIIEEISIKDLTKGGTFKDAIDSIDKDYGLGYLKTLGFTHLEVLPVFGFGGVDEINKKDYNWGYNPVSYGSISNYLTKDYQNPYGSVNEFKELVDLLHQNNLGLIMDVVFNHVYDINNFSFALINPGYGFHTDEIGFLTNFSGCGNDINTKRLMMRRFIIDMCKYYVSEYKIDGLRFDLMCLLDVETLNQVKEECLKINPNLILLGEGWNMQSSLDSSEQGKMQNFYLLDGFKFFNDSFRNLVKPNYAFGQEINHEELYSAFTGYCVKEELFSNPLTSINYCECHDNYTFYDLLIKNKPNISKEEVIDRIILSLGMVVLSSGVPFLHLGEEFARTKQGVENSYNSPLSINQIDYNRRNDYQEVINSLKEFIKLKKKYEFFNLSNHYDVEKRIRLESKTGDLILRYLDENNNSYKLIVKNNYEKSTIYFSPNNRLIFDSRSVTDVLCTVIELTKPGIYLFKK